MFSGRRLEKMIKRTLFAVFTLIISIGTQAETVKNTYQLEPFEAHYIAYMWGDPLGHATMKLEPLSHNQYSLWYQSKVSKFFLSDRRTEHSIFFLEEGEIKAKEYHYKRTGTGSDKKLDVSFDASTQLISVLKNKDSFDLPWQGEIDNQLYRLSIAEFLANGDTSFELNFINYRGQKKTYRFVVETNEDLELPYGSLATIKVKIQRENSKRETFAWYAPSLNYQLVRLQQFKEGKEQGDIKLSKFTLLSNVNNSFTP